MENLTALVDALEDAAKSLQASARRLRREKNAKTLQAAADLAEVDRTILELHHRIVHLLGEQVASHHNAGGRPGPTPEGEIGLDELTKLLYRTINPPESRRNYTYTPPFSIEKVLRAYLTWITGPGKNVNIRP